MVKTASTMLSLGTEAPDFSLLDTVTNQIIKRPNKDQYKATVIFFICNHCPFVKHINHELVRVANEYIAQNIAFIAINSNDTSNYPDDDPEQMKITAENLHYPFPYLFDSTQEVAKAYQAACTPDFFVFNSDLSLAYRGQFDDSRPGNNIPQDGASLRDALDSLINNTPMPQLQKPSIGCNIKWRS